MQVNIYEAKTQLSKLIEQAEKGNEVIIAKAGKPVARLTAIHEVHKKRLLGLLNNQFNIPNDFDAPLPDELLAQFEGSGE